MSRTPKRRESKGSAFTLLVYPLLLGAGKRLFSTTDKDAQKLKLVEHDVYANGLQKNVFAVVR